MPEAELLLIPGFGRRVCSEQYKYEGYGDSFTGYVIAPHLLGDGH